MSKAKIEQLKIKRDAAMQVAVEVVDSMLFGLGRIYDEPRYDLIRYAVNVALGAKEDLEQAVRDMEKESVKRNREFNAEDMAVEERIAERMGL